MRHKTRRLSGLVSCVCASRRLSRLPLSVPRSRASSQLLSRRPLSVLRARAWSQRLWRQPLFGGVADGRRVRAMTSPKGRHCNILQPSRCWRSQGTISIGGIDNLIEPSDSVTHMPFIGQRLFPLFRKGKNAVGQVALLRKPSVFLMRHPGRTRRELLSMGSLREHPATKTGAR